MSQESSEGQLMIQLVSADPAPPAHADNRWVIGLSSGEDAPLAGASVVATPYMVDHGHAAPTTVSRELGEGLYELAPITLTMTGFWEITLKVVTADAAPTSATFGFCVRDP